MNTHIVVVDTNRLLSAILPSSVADRRTLQRRQYQFVTPNYTIVELFKHKETILHKARGDAASVLEYMRDAIECVNFISVGDIDVGTFLEAHRLCRRIDPNDTAFIALTLHLNGVLWTRDDTLKIGLEKQGFQRFFSANDR
jgi:predicted nucleic acid-binding protein